MREPDALVTDAGRTEATVPAWTRLRRRADFQRVARGRRAQAESFALQARARAEAEVGQARPRVGFTVTRKIGGAVERNRIRRRLKAALVAASAIAPNADSDYVLVARRPALTRRFAALVADVERAFAQIGRARPAATDRDPRS
jgi:ribonuclease P protein component